MPLSFFNTKFELDNELPTDWFFFLLIFLALNNIYNNSREVSIKHLFPPYTFYEYIYFRAFLL